LKINPYGKKIVLYYQTEKTIPVVEMNVSAAVEIDLTTYESTTIATNLLADKLCNVEYTQNNQVQIITTNYIAATPPTGNILRLADKNVYQNIVLSNQLVSTTNVINFNNYLNGFVANSNVRYYKTTKEPDIFTRIVGNKIYEINDHLGNVRATVSDRRLGENADLRSTVMYYPFGMPIANRTQSLNYRFGFNGKENDNEISGFGMKLDFGAREYDTQIGRWWGVDPMSEKNSAFTPYCFVFNSPIGYKDPDGMDGVWGVIETKDETGKVINTHYVMTAKIYITGKGATPSKAAKLNKQAKDFLQTQTMENGDKVSILLNYEYKENITTDELEDGENILEVKGNSYKKIGSSYAEVNNEWYGLTTGTRGEICKEDENFFFAYIHESLHFIGLSDRYDKKTKKPHEGFESDVMGTRDIKEIKDVHFKNFYEYLKNENELNKIHRTEKISNKHKTFVDKYPNSLRNGEKR